jgi:hypothetical protein
MYRIAIVLLTAVLLPHGLGLGIVYADGMVLPAVLSPDYVAVRYHHVTVDIEDAHAVTRVDQEFYNPHPYPVSGRYLFPVPPDAILSRFRATVDGVAQSVLRQDAAVTNAALHANTGTHLCCSMPTGRRWPLISTSRPGVRGVWRWSTKRYWCRQAGCSAIATC